MVGLLVLKAVFHALAEDVEVAWHVAHESLNGWVLFCSSFDAYSAAPGRARGPGNVPPNERDKEKQRRSSGATENTSAGLAVYEPYLRRISAYLGAKWSRYAGSFRKVSPDTRRYGSDTA